MNKEQLLKKIETLDLLADPIELKKDILKEANKIIDSGAVNYSEEPDDSFALAKAIISAIFLKLHKSTYPLTEEYRKVTDNLRHF